MNCQGKKLRKISHSLQPQYNNIIIISNSISSMHLGINLFKEVNNLYNENVKSFKKEKSNKTVEFPYSYIGKINIMKK